MTTSGIYALIAVGVCAFLVLTSTASTIKRKGYNNVASLLPNCPGIERNVTLNPDKVRNFEFLLETIGKDGKFYAKKILYDEIYNYISKNPHFDVRNKRTVVYLVGYLDDFIYPHTRYVNVPFLQRGYNVIIASTLNFYTGSYVESVSIARAVGYKIGDMLVNLKSLGLRGENLELIGLSLGAQVVAHTAKTFYQHTGEKPFRIIGLDPAGPCYRYLPAPYRLDSSDAHNVLVIHTNIRGFGMERRMGHVDFYVNGGEYQLRLVSFVPCYMFCSHFLSVFFWWSSLENPGKFIGMKCDSVEDAIRANCYDSNVTNTLGFETDFSKPGVYYVAVTNEYPFYMGENGLIAPNGTMTDSFKMTSKDINYVETLINDINDIWKTDDKVERRKRKSRLRSQRDSRDAVKKNRRKRLSDHEETDIRVLLSIMT